MEYCIAATVLGIGYIFNKDGLKRPVDKTFVSNVSKNNIPSGSNIYESKRSLEVNKEVQNLADKSYKRSNTIIPGPPQAMMINSFNKVDYENNQLPISFDLAPKDIDIPKQHKDTKEMSESATGQMLASGGWQDITSNDEKVVMSLTGEEISKTDFNHNNMVPFFGSNVRQNVDEYANRHVIENFTGNDISNYKKKTEVECMFKPQTNVTNVYGANSIAGFNKDRYIVSNISNNIGPTEKIYVGPGLNQGYTSMPSGGFQQANARDYALPITTNEGRVKTNPKLSYKGVVIPGKKISKPGLQGEVAKNNPDTFFVNTPERYFTTTGACTGAKQRPKVILKYVNRKNTGSKQYIAPGVSTGQKSEKARPLFKKTARQQFSGPGMRHLGASNKWTVKDISGDPSDYGKSNLGLRKTVRTNTSNNKHANVNLTSADRGSTGRAPINPRLRKTRKTNVVGNSRWASNIETPHNRGVVYDPNDLPRTTIKETNINDETIGFMGQQRPSKQNVYDPNDIARTTVKETNIDNETTGNMGQQGQTQQQVYDPNDVARTTVKETNIDNETTGNMGQQGQTQQQVYDPNDVARTTVKETNINNETTGYMNPQQPGKSTTYDPTDILRITNKQTTLGSHIGNVNKQKKGTGYLHKKVVAKTTARQTTSHEYTGDAYGNIQGGYKVTKVVAPNTHRQTTGKKSYSGGAIAGGSLKPRRNEDIYNATVRSLREGVSKGRLPANSGPKQNVNKNDVNMTTNRTTDVNNKNIKERGLTTSKIYNSIPQPQQCGQTKDKTTLPNEPIDDRNNPAILKAFIENPYTQSLTSSSL